MCGISEGVRALIPRYTIAKAVDSRYLGDTGSELVLSNIKTLPTMTPSIFDEHNNTCIDGSQDDILFVLDNGEVRKRVRTVV